jgi:hypothetical protein
MANAKLNVSPIFLPDSLLAPRAAQAPILAPRVTQTPAALLATPWGQVAGSETCGTSTPRHRAFAPTLIHPFTHSRTQSTAQPRTNSTAHSRTHSLPHKALAGGVGAELGGGSLRGESDAPREIDRAMTLAQRFSPRRRRHQQPRGGLNSRLDTALRVEMRRKRERAAQRFAAGDIAWHLRSVTAQRCALIDAQQPRAQLSRNSAAGRPVSCIGLGIAEPHGEVVLPPEETSQDEDDPRRAAPGGTREGE